MANQKVAGAQCELTNDNGKFYVTTPGTVTVHRAYGDLAVTCQHLRQRHAGAVDETAVFLKKEAHTGKKKLYA